MKGNFALVARSIWTTLHSLGLLSTQELSTLNEKEFYSPKEKFLLTLDPFFWKVESWATGAEFDI